MIEYIAEKPTGYYKDPRLAVVRLVEKGSNRVLDVGCGEGRTGEALKACGKAVEVVGVEKNPEVAEVARGLIDQVICVDVENLLLPSSQGYFDCIILGDVIEHLRNPWITLEHLGSYLRTGGRVIASIPNVRYWRVIASLVLGGDWRYAPCGVLDDGHLRFFTRKSINRLFRSSRFVVERITPEFRCLSWSERSAMKRVCGLVDVVTVGLFEGFLTLRYIVVARKP